QTEQVGCADELACNYDASATEEGYCDYPEIGYGCSGSCLQDSDLDGVCDEFEIMGCTDVMAQNYDANATDDANNCVFYNSGCTYHGACNYDDEAATDDGTCHWNCVGCMDENALNYDSGATVESDLCFFCETGGGGGSSDEETCIGDLNVDGIRGTADLLILLSYFGLMCEE
ncbi:hypothetical protein N8891_06310, partial [Flavobacteriales bacterium]|nr:hypothetical protein [Flavobacteriales bacterium]